MKTRPPPRKEYPKEQITQSAKYHINNQKKKKKNKNKQTNYKHNTQSATRQKHNHTDQQLKQTLLNQILQIPGMNNPNNAPHNLHFPFSQESSPHLPLDLSNNAFFRSRNVSMKKIIPKSPKVVHSSPKAKFTNNRRKQAFSTNFGLKPLHGLTTQESCMRARQIKAAPKEHVLFIFHVTMTK
jgi:hypothetical protein